MIIFQINLKNEKRNIKNTWKVLNNALNKNQYRPCNTEFNLNGTVINNPTQVSDHFNDFFINIGQIKSLKFQIIIFISQHI